MKEVYKPEIPKDAAVTVPKTSVPASPDKNLTNKALGYDLKVSKSGFSPTSLTVGEFDTVELDFTAVDGDFALNIPYLGISFAPVAKGKTQRLTFTPTLSGTFAMEAGALKGSLIVLPYKR